MDAKEATKITLELRAKGIPAVLKKYIEALKELQDMRDRGENPSIKHIPFLTSHYALMTSEITHEEAAKLTMALAKSTNSKESATLEPLHTVLQEMQETYKPHDSSGAN